MVSYPPQGYGPQGYPQHGQPSPGYGPYGYGGPPSPALAYIAAVVFIVAGALELVFAIMNWTGDGDSIEIALALFGGAFTEDLTGNVDFAISATMSLACSSILFGLVMFARLAFARWILVFLGGVATLYYIYAIVWVLDHDGGEYIAMVLVTWVLWLAATVIAVLPATGRGMRGKQRPPGYPQQGYPQPGYPQQY